MPYEHRQAALGYIINPPIRGGLIDSLISKRFEPVRRNKDGLRYVSHRFPIKGGISQLEVMSLELTESMSRTSSLYAKFAEKAENGSGV